jgi:L-threonylcarbamoyladenylate synthase
MSQSDFSRALKALKNGDVIIYPTDTLYALGADIFNEEAVKRVFEIKHRPFSIPLPVAVASKKAIETIASLNENAHRIIDRFLPGTLTVLLKKKASVPMIVTSGSETIAIRIPQQRIALRLLSEFGPLTVTSANLHHEKTPGIIKDILMQLQTEVPVAFDVGRLDTAPSTIVDLTKQTPRVVRSGIITEQELLDAIADG